MPDPNEKETIVLSTGNAARSALCVAGMVVLTPLADATQNDGTCSAAALSLPSDGSMTVATGSRFNAELIAALSEVPHVDGAYLGRETDVSVAVFVLAADHGLVPREMLLEIEDRLSAGRPKPVVLSVRAHQGRDLKDLAGNAGLLFSRG